MEKASSLPDRQPASDLQPPDILRAATARYFARQGARSHSSLGSLNSTFDYIFTYLGA